MGEDLDGRLGLEAFECADPYVTDVIRWLGDDHIVFETDFPHPDSKYPRVIETFLKLLPDQLTPESKRKILWDNAVDLYRFRQHLREERAWLVRLDLAAPR